MRKNGKFCRSAAFEYKVSHKKRINFLSDFQPQQIDMLYEAKHGCVYKKHSDLDPGMKPYDASQICYAEAWIVILWYHYRKPKRFQMIDVDKIIEFKKTHKSITEEEAEEIADYTFIL